MTKFLLKLLGVPDQNAGDVGHGYLALRGGIHPGWVVAAAVVLAVAVLLMYRRAAVHLSPARKYTLAVLRAVFLMLILALLLKPVLAFTIETQVRRGLVLLLDTSNSMKVEDPRVDVDDLKRAALARGLLDPSKGLKQDLPAVTGGNANRLDKAARVDLYKSALKNEKLDLLPRLSKDYDLRPFAFSSALTDLTPVKSGDSPQGAPATTQPAAGPYAWVDGLAPDGNLSPIGDAVRDLVARTRGQPLGGIFLVTDGDNNSGIDPHVAAAMAKQAGVPLYVYGVGISSPKDLTAVGVFAPEVSFVKDDVPVSVQVRSQGVRQAKVTLFLADPNGENEEKVDERDLTFSADGEQVVSLTVKPTRKGEFKLRAVVAPDEAGVAEISKDDNVQSQRLRVIDNKIKVLYVEQSPRWEFKYVMATLLRDPRVDFKTVLLEGDAGLASAPNSPYLKQLPLTKEEWLGYDLILWGDVDPKAMNEAHVDAIDEFVSRFGGGLVMVAGKRFDPWAYRNTKLEAMLPVELEIGNPTAASGTADEIHDAPIRPELTAAGRRSVMLRLAAEEQVSLQKWSLLPPIYWTAPVARAKPAADVLLVDPSPVRASRYGKMPVVAVQPYGLGQVMFLGTDNFWRWRKNLGEGAYASVWSQVVQRMALPHLLGASKRTQLTLDKESYGVNETVRVFARLYTETYQPVEAETVKGYVTESGPDDPRAREVTLRRLPDQPGMYRAEFNAPDRAAGYKLFVEGDRNTLVDMAVTAPRSEPGPTALNEPLLRDIAQSTGGAFLREEDLITLPDLVKAQPSVVKTNLEVELWSSPLYFVMMLGVVTTEWVIRKMSQLK